MSYPRSFIAPLQALSGFSRNSFRIQPLSGAGPYGPGDQVQVFLPTGLVNLSSFTMHYRITCSGNSANTVVVPSRHSETLIEQLTVDINGQVVDQGCPNSANLVNLMLDYLGGDKTTQRGLLSHDNLSGFAGATPTTGTTYFTNATEAALSTTAQAWNAPQENQISNWMGFLGSCTPSVYNSEIAGMTRVTIRLSPAAVLLTNSTTAVSYSLSNVYFTCDVFSLSDGIFAGVVDRIITEKGSFDYRFQRWLGYTSGQQGNLNGSLKFNISSGSVDLMVATILPSDFVTRNTNNHQVGTGTSSYFTRGVAGNAATPGSSVLTDSYFMVNSVRFPSYTCTTANAAQQTLNAFGVLTDTLGSGNPRFGSLNNWGQLFFTHAQRFNVLTGPADATYKSGLNTQGINIPMAYETTGQATNTIVGAGMNMWVWVQCTSDLHIGAGKQVIVEL